MISLDIGNARYIKPVYYSINMFRGYGGGFNMDSLWQVSILFTSLFLLVLIPFALFFYETDENKAFVILVQTLQLIF